MSKLFSMLIADQLNELAYEAEVAGVNYHIEPTVTGLTVLLGGYNDKIHILNEMVFNKIVNMRGDGKEKIDEQHLRERFAIIKSDLSDMYKAIYKNQPYEHALRCSYEALTQVKWTFEASLEALKSIDYEMLMHQFIPLHLSCLKIEMFILGNIVKQEALNMIHQVEDIVFSGKTLPPLKCQMRMDERIVQLESGKDYLIQRLAFNPQDNNSAIELIYQIGLRNVEEDVLLELLQQILSAPYFAQLRTVEQIGYLVFSRVRRDNNVNSLSLLLQSGDKSPVHMRVRSDLFLQEFYQVLKQMSDEEIMEHMGGLRTKIEEKDKQLADENMRYWKEIETQQYRFDRVRDKLRALEQLNKQKLVDFYAKYLLLTSDSCRRVIIQYFAKEHWPTTTTTTSEEQQQQVNVKIEDSPDSLTDEERQIIVTREPVYIAPDITLSQWKSGMNFYPGYIQY